MLREGFLDPYYAGNIWLVRGSARTLVVDTASGIVPPRAYVEALDHGSLSAVSLCRYYDHMGGLFDFPERGCHVLEAEAIESPREETTYASFYVTDAIFRAYPREGFAASDYAVTGAEPTFLLGDGDRIDLGDRRVEVLHVPGMSPGSIAVWEAATGSLFTSDTLFPDPEERPIAPLDPVAYRRSLGRLGELPVRHLFGGHYDAVDGDRFRQLLDTAARSIVARAH